ncbi:uncharacterized protein M6B38_401280 [Iris pallida]|uniref:Uncharacterized protein n=1 Tax=Iris pallida TaxID=29817 RepID=A0AAX6FTN3_IRIPA|nr:uncharacterized protein M6B38_401280 [Iris pallida]
MNEWMDGWAKWDVLYRDFNSWEVDLELILLSNDIAWESYGSRAEEEEEEEEEGPPLPFANKKLGHHQNTKKSLSLLQKPTKLTDYLAGQ